MSPHDKPRTTQRLPGRWWVVWLAVAFLGALIPFFHWRWRVAELIEPLRYPWGLLPAHWLIFRDLGHLAGWVLVGVAIAGIVAWFRPAVGRQAIVLSAVITLAFTVFYGIFCGKLIHEIIKEQRREIEEERERTPLSRAVRQRLTGARGICIESRPHLGFNSPV